MRRKLNRVARLDLSRGSEYNTRYRDLAYIVLEIPKEAFGFPEWTPGEGFVQTSRCCFVKIDEFEMTCVFGPLYPRDGVSDFADEDQLVVYTKKFPLPLSDEGESAFSEAFNKPRRILWSGHDDVEVTSWKDHPWRPMQDAKDFEFTFKNGFEPMESLGLTPGDWDYTSVEANLFLPREGTYGVVLPWDFEDYSNKDYTNVGVAAKILRKWGGTFRIMPGRDRLHQSNIYEWAL